MPGEVTSVNENLTQPDMDRQPVVLKPGLKCPQCGQGSLDYDGMLNLACPVCDFADEGGCFT